MSRKNKNLVENLEVKPRVVIQEEMLNKQKLLQLKLLKVALLGEEEEKMITNLEIVKLNLKVLESKQKEAQLQQQLLKLQQQLLK